MADDHFCTCDNFQCKLHPRNHSNGCDGCIKVNLKVGNIPRCFFVSVSATGYSKKVKGFSYKDFAEFVQDQDKNRNNTR